MTQVSAGLVGRQVRAPKTAELIAAQLRGQIVRGSLKAGDTLPSEQGLMQQFGVSRPTLREAFRILESESLILVRRGSRGGVQVTAPDLGVAARYIGLILQMANTTLADVYETRMVLEPAAVRMLAQRHTKKDIADLNRCVTELDVLVSGGVENADLGEWSAASFRFHALLMERSRNTTLATFSGVLHEIVASHMAAAVNRSVDPGAIVSQFTKTIGNYRKLIDLIEQSNAEEAEEFWRRHMSSSARKLLWGELANESVVDLFSGWTGDVSFPAR